MVVKDQGPELSDIRSGALVGISVKETAVMIQVRPTSTFAVPDEPSIPSGALDRAIDTVPTSGALKYRKNSS